MFKNIFTLLVAAALILPQTALQSSAASWRDFTRFEVASNELPVYGTPSKDSRPKFNLYKGMEIESVVADIVDGEKWLKIDSSRGQHWIPASEKGGIYNVSAVAEAKSGIVDYYDILEQPHNYAVKLVKYADKPEGRIETFKRIDGDYVHHKTYNVTYPKVGPKDRYGDLKTVGGPVVRYLYRTKRSSMNGYLNGERFGVYKVSYPMPHDALPWVLEGRMSLAEYNRIPTINYRGPENDKQLYPHPQGRLGADILIHTEKHGSLGCILVDHAEMYDLFFEDLVSESNKEIIPFIIYDEDMVPTPEGQLL